MSETIKQAMLRMAMRGTVGSVIEWDSFCHKIEALEAERQWISVEDRLPEVGQYVLVHPPFVSTVFDDEPRHVLEYRGDGEFVYYLGGSVHSPYPTYHMSHWLPLPNPPEGE